MPTANRNEDAFEALLVDLHAKLQADTRRYGVTPEELAQLETLAADYRARRQEKRKKALEAQAATAAFNAVAKTAKPFVSKLRQRMNLHPEMDEQARQAYNLAQRGGARASLSVPGEAPQISLDFGTRGRMTIHAGSNPGNLRRNGKPKGAVGILVQCHEDGAPTNDSEWQHLAQVTKSPVTHQPGNGMRTFAYRACYVDRKGNRSPWSDVVVGTIGA